MFNIKMPWKTDIDDEDEKVKTEQKPLNPENEPETKIVDGGSSYDYISLYNTEFTSAKELILTYRNMASNFEIGEAIDEIENDAVVVEDDESISINTDRTKLSEVIQKKIRVEFDIILKLLDWDSMGSRLFRRWYVDSRLYQQKVMYANPKLGLEKIILLDPLKITRIKDKKTKEVYFQYVYNKEETYLFPEDGITYTTSSLTDPSHSFWISELHKSIRPLNNLRLIEDSALIYYITRAPSKRAFYIDVGNTSSKKAEEKVKQIMQKFRQRVSYDSTTGSMTHQKRSIPVNEDYYLATRGDTRGTKIEPIAGDTNLLDPEMLSYFKKKLYKSMGVPYARVDDDTSGTTIDYSSNETTSQELKFAKQTQKRRKRFSSMFDDLLKTQLIAKKIISIDDWQKIKQEIYYVWKNDSYYSMLKQQEILSKQIELAENIDAFVGKYFSNEYVRKVIFSQSDDDIKREDEEIKSEKTDERYQVKEEE